jgi:hypothetical protein
MKSSSVLAAAVAVFVSVSAGHALAVTAPELDWGIDPDVLHMRLEFIKDEGLRVPEKDRDHAESKLAMTSRNVDRSARRIGDANMAARLAEEFHATAKTLLDEKDSLNATWGEIVVGHTLAANARSAVTVNQILGLERQGMGWGTIAAGMGFGLRATVDAARRESRIAMGKSKPDGRIAAIRISDQVAAEGPEASTEATP